MVVYQNGQIWGMGFAKPVNSTRLWALLDFLSSWNLRKRNCDQKCDLMDWRQLESVCNHLTIKVKCKGDTLLMLQQLFIFGLEKIITRKRWKCFWPDWLVITSASAALSKKSILDYFSECWLSNEPQSRQDVCDNDDRGWHLVGSLLLVLLGFLLGWKISEYCRKALLSWKGIDFPICRIIHHS